MRRSRIVNVAAIVLIGSALVGAILLNGRGHESVRPDEPGAAAVASPSASPTPSFFQSYIPVVDTVIGAELRGEWHRLQRLLRYRTVPCAEGADGSRAPACRPGEDDGAIVDVLPIDGCQPSFQRPEEFRAEGITSEGVRLYGVYFATPDTYPPAKYVVVFLRKPIVNGTPAETAFSLSLTDDAIAGIHYGCGLTAAQFVANQHLSAGIVAPAQAIRYQSGLNKGVYQPIGDPVIYAVCSEGYGWVRPSPDDQRRYLSSLGGEFQQFASDPGLLFVGAYTTDELGRNTWHYGNFWAMVTNPETEQYALARTGLWSATPNTSACNRTAELTMLIDRRVTEIRFDGMGVWISSREAPGYFQVVQYTVPPADVGYNLLAEDGTWIDGCCN